MKNKSFIQKVRENNIENIPTLLLFLSCLIYDTSWCVVAPGLEEYSGKYGVSSITGFNYHGIGWIFFCINAILVYLSLVLDKNKIETSSRKNLKTLLNIILIGYVIYFIFGLSDTNVLKPSYFVYTVLIFYFISLLFFTKILKLNEIFRSKEEV